jgi:hypothetical protein
MGRKLLLRALVAVVVLLVVLAGIEGVSSAWLMAQEIRAIRPTENFRQARYDTLLGWVGLPNLHIANNYGPGIHLTTNADGMRIHRPVSAALAPGTRRAICSGDSFAFGSGVADDQTMCAYLESELPGLETLNMAQRGFGIDQAYLWYRRDGARYTHQLHLFAFIWADFERMAVTSFTGYSKPILKLRDGRLVTENVPVPRWSATTKAYEVQNILMRSRLFELARRPSDQSDAANLRRVDAQVWNVAEAVFLDLARLNAERHSQLVLVYLPNLVEFDAGPHDVRRARLEQFSKRTGIPLVDLTPDLRAVPRDSLDWLFITANQIPVRGSAGHYSPRGNHWAAERLAVHLRDLPAVSAILSPSAAVAPVGPSASGRDP